MTQFKQSMDLIERTFEYYIEGADEPIRLTANMVKDYLVSGKKEFVTVEECVLYMNQCKALKLNPWLRECYLVKYSANEKAQIITSIQFKRSQAMIHPLCQGWETGLIFYSSAGEELRTRGIIPADQGGVSWELAGAYFKAHPKGWITEYVLEINLAPYIKRTKDGSITQFWRKENQPEQLKKVVESQGLSNLFSKPGQARMYIAEEIQPDDEPIDLKPLPRRIPETTGPDEDGPGPEPGAPGPKKIDPDVYGGAPRSIDPSKAPERPKAPDVPEDKPEPKKDTKAQADPPKTEKTQSAPPKAPQTPEAKTEIEEIDYGPGRIPRREGGILWWDNKANWINRRSETVRHILRIGLGMNTPSPRIPEEEQEAQEKVFKALLNHLSDIFGQFEYADGEIQLAYQDKFVRMFGPQAWAAEINEAKLAASQREMAAKYEEGDAPIVNITDQGPPGLSDEELAALTDGESSKVEWWKTSDDADKLAIHLGELRESHPFPFAQGYDRCKPVDSIDSMRECIETIYGIIKGEIDPLEGLDIPDAID